MDVIAPIIHLNGTSAERLKDALSNAYDKLYEASEALRECGPNGRDYYLKPGLMEKAIEQHRGRQHAIRDVMAGIEAEMDAIDEQTKDRKQ